MKDYTNRTKYYREQKRRQRKRNLNEKSVSIVLPISLIEQINEIHQNSSIPKKELYTSFLQEAVAEYYKKQLDD